jgi:glyoxylate/hydroxypyruvate reductase
MPDVPHRAPVLIASYLDQTLADRIATAEPDRVELLYAPDLLPPPRYEADHHAPRRVLDATQLARWRALVARAEVSFEFDWDEPTTMMARARGLRWVQATSSGIGPQLVRLGVAGSPLVVTNAAGIHAQPLAEFVLHGVLHFTKEMPRLSEWKAEHHWERYCGEEAAGKRMLVVGLGKVGSRIAELCAAIGIEVIGLRRRSDAPLPPGVRRLIDATALDAELPALDFLTLAAPDTPETTNLLNAARLELLPARAVVINVGRGSLIDEPALASRLAAGALRGAALDVFAKEPLPADSPLWSLPNVIVSPHSASTVAAENARLVDLFVENLRRYFDGDPLLNHFDHSHLA